MAWQDALSEEELSEILFLMDTWNEESKFFDKNFSKEESYRNFLRQLIAKLCVMVMDLEERYIKEIKNSDYKPNLSESFKKYTEDPTKFIE